MLKQQAAVLEGIAETVDLGLIVASFASSALISSRPVALAWLLKQSGHPVAISSNQYTLLLGLSLASWIVAAKLRESYVSARSEHSGSVVWDNLVTGMLWALLVAGSSFFFKLELISRSFLMIFLPLAMLALGARQTVVQILARYLRARGFNLRDVVVVGDRDRVARFGDLVREEAGTGYRIVRQIITEPDLPLKFDDLEFDEAFFLLGSSGADLEQLVMRFVNGGKRVHFVPGILDARLFRHGLTEFAGTPLLTVGGYGLTLPQTVAKRACDIAGSLVLITVLAPLFVIVGLLVKFSSSGPILFSQMRLGTRGRLFRIYKFRSMYVNAEEILHSNPALYKKYVHNNYKLPKGEDFRITPIGAILRSTSLDELPQLFNVLKGEMSLVGPRPVVPAEITMYGECGPLFMSVKPGMTGYWQIKGRSGVEDYSSRAALDLQYIRDQSLINDVDILLRTIPAVVLRRGAH